MSRKNMLHLIRTVVAKPYSCPRLSPAGCTVKQTDKNKYAFETPSLTLRFGAGVGAELGAYLRKINAKFVCLITDTKVAALPSVKAALDSLHHHKINYEIYDETRIEPTDESLWHAVSFVRSKSFDAFVAIGGGSAIDTCKIANLYACDRNANLLDYVNKPVGKGKQIRKVLKPLVALPTTAGTGSETTGIAIFACKKLKLKTGISSPLLKPKLCLIDTLHALSTPERVTAYAGFDVFCRALESYTAVDYRQLGSKSTAQKLRLHYSTSNLWARFSLKLIKENLIDAIYQADNLNARANMLLASTLAGMDAGGSHLCHAISHPIASMVHDFRPKDYAVKHKFVPHGLSVAITAPALFEYTGPACPEQHLEAAEILGADISHANCEDGGKLLADTLRDYMQKAKIENGLKALGFMREDIPTLVEGALPLKRIVELAPHPQTRDDLTKLFEKSMTVY